jgi:DNA polymerase-3 subunit delta
MKYQNLIAFEKHLEQAAKVQLSRIFLIVSSCSYERKKIAQKVISAILAREKQIDLQDGAQKPIEELIEGLNTSSLFSSHQVLYLDGIEKTKKNGLSLLAEYAASPSPFAYLVLGSSSSKGLTELCTKGKKELVICDLVDEKPWDRKERFRRHLIDYAAASGKRLYADAAEYLLDNIGLSLPSLEQELEKLITYSAERKEVTLQDVTALCSVQKSQTLWQLAEAIAWKEAIPQVGSDFDLNTLLPLISQLRTQFQNGLSVAVLMQRQVPHAEIALSLPLIKPAALDKIVPIARMRRIPFFKRAIDLLFEMEIMAKNSSFSPGLILDLFLSKLALLKRHFSQSLSQ